jgi:hypothetical protein
MKPAILTVLLLASSSAPIAHQPARQPGFDVVSIKPSQPDAQNRLPRISPGRVELFNTTLKQLIASAYSRFPFDPRELVGGPAWIDSERFDIVATMERPPQFDQTGCSASSTGCFVHSSSNALASRLATSSVRAMSTHSRSREATERLALVSVRCPMRAQRR